MLFFHGSNFQGGSMPPLFIINRRMAYTFFPTTASEIQLELKSADQAKVAEIMDVFAWLKAKFPTVETPINIDKSKLTLINVTRMLEGDVELNALQSAFMNIATAKVALSGEDAREMGILRPQDRISVNKDRQILDAKAAAIELAEAGYTMPVPAKNIRVMGKSGLALFAAGVTGMKMGNFISEHDMKIAMKIANVMCGGDLSYPQEVSEQYLLDLEREAFVSLCGERKTLERIQSILTGGKPLRN